MTFCKIAQLSKTPAEVAMWVAFQDAATIWVDRLYFAGEMRNAKCQMRNAKCDKSDMQNSVKLKSVIRGIGSESGDPRVSLA